MREIFGVAVLLLAIGIVLAVGAQVSSKMKETVNDSTANSILDTILEAFSDASSWLKIFVVIVFAGLIIRTLITSFGSGSTPRY